MPLNFNKLILFIAVLSLSGCSLLGKSHNPKAVQSPQQKVFAAPFDEVWRAAQISLTKYPMRINNVDLGILETDFIKGSEGWQAPGEAQVPSGGMRYKLSIRIIKGKFQTKPAVKVTILKRAEIKRDFFSDVEKLSSDGLEELSLMYRIQRELAIEQVIKSAHKKANQTVQYEDFSKTDTDSFEESPQSGKKSKTGDSPE